MEIKRRVVDTTKSEHPYRQPSNPTKDGK